MNKKEMDKYFNELSKIRVKCLCSHTMFFPSYDADIKICTHCGNKVYKNEKAKFIDILKCKLNAIHHQN